MVRFRVFVVIVIVFCEVFVEVCIVGILLFSVSGIFLFLVEGIEVLVEGMLVVICVVFWVIGLMGLGL